MDEAGFCGQLFVEKRLPFVPSVPVHSLMDGGVGRHQLGDQRSRSMPRFGLTALVRHVPPGDDSDEPAPLADPLELDFFDDRRIGPTAGA
ncbi:MAG: hypothetical protein IIC29_05755 [Chloroflexi bacterium]|nr:hypothetical protein [Chloroflexota bacterium]